MVQRLLAGVMACAIAFGNQTFAQARNGTADEAKAMLLRAVAPVKAARNKTLGMFNGGEGGFLDRDLYPFCGNVHDGKILALANPNAKRNLGKDIRENKDPTGKAYGEEIYAAGQREEGRITSVSYRFSRPGDPAPVAKVSFVTRVG